jgi:SAM-dependent methyltransferase
MKIWKLFIFNVIMPVYALIFRLQVKKYGGILERFSAQAGIEGYSSVLDVGCGNGALVKAFKRKGFRAAGVDFLPAMATVAKRNLKKDEDIEIRRADVLEGLPFADKSFDLAIASYMLHGMRPGERKKVYAEMGRVAGKAVIFYDYNANRAPLTSVIEAIEGGDYFNFIRTGREEMEKYFASVQVIDVDKRAAWYICRTPVRTEVHAESRPGAQLAFERRQKPSVCLGRGLAFNCGKKKGRNPAGTAV